MSGISKDAIMRWVGHASTQMIDRTYGHLLGKYQAEEMKKFRFFTESAVLDQEGMVKKDDDNVQSPKASGSPVGAPEGKQRDCRS